MTLTVPVIETERLILREPRESEFETYAAFAASDRARFVGGPSSRWDSWRGFLSSIGHWVLRGYGFWTIELRETGKPAGRAGFIFHDGWSEPELGWQVFDGFEGKSIAYEAALAAREYGAAHMGLDGVISHIDPENHSSKALARRLGAVAERDCTFFGKPCQIWRHPKTEAI